MPHTADQDSRQQ